MFGVNEAKKLQTEATVAEGGLFLPAFHALLEDLSAGTPTVLSCQASRRTKNSLNEERECQPVCVHECMCVSVCVGARPEQVLIPDVILFRWNKS